MGRGNRYVLFIILFIASIQAFGKERLVLSGGGSSKANQKATDTIVKWANEAGGKILRIGWASEEAPLAEEIVETSSYPFPEGTVIEAPSRFKMEKEKNFFLEKQLRVASAVYFSGGDQSRIMDVLKDEDLKSALVAAFKSGVVFGGTSAGLAIMSRKMFTGKGNEEDIDPEGPELREGLGLLSGVMLDQHFLRQKRLNRLLSTILKKVEPIGVGVDEDSAVTVEDGRFMTVLGPNKVVIVNGGCEEDGLSVKVLLPGAEYDLVEQKKIKSVALNQ